MERSTLNKLALVWGVMLLTLIVMVIQSPVNPLTPPTQPQGNNMQLGDVFGQLKQFMGDVQTNITPPPGLR